MVNDKPIQILVADDHPVVRRGLSSLIDIESGMELVGEAVDGVEAVEMARSLQPDVILLELMMPRKNGLEAIHELKQANPEARILVVTSFAQDDKVFPAIMAGAHGYLLKTARLKCCFKPSAMFTGERRRCILLLPVRRCRNSAGPHQSHHLA